MLILFVIATILSCIFSFVCYSILYVFIFIGICAGIIFMIEHFTFWGAFFLIEELFILIPLLYLSIISSSTSLVIIIDPPESISNNGNCDARSKSQNGLQPAVPLLSIK